MAHVHSRCFTADDAQSNQFGRRGEEWMVKQTTSKLVQQHVVVCTESPSPSSNCVAVVSVIHFFLISCFFSCFNAVFFWMFRSVLPRRRPREQKEGIVYDFEEEEDKEWRKTNPRRTKGALPFFSLQSRGSTQVDKQHQKKRVTTTKGIKWRTPIGESTSLVIHDDMERERDISRTTDTHLQNTAPTLHVG